MTNISIMIGYTILKFPKVFFFNLDMMIFFFFFKLAHKIEDEFFCENCIKNARVNIRELKAIVFYAAQHCIL